MKVYSVVVTEAQIPSIDERKEDRKTGSSKGNVVHMGGVYDLLVAATSSLAEARRHPAFYNIAKFNFGMLPKGTPIPPSGPSGLVGALIYLFLHSYWYNGYNFLRMPIGTILECYHKAHQCLIMT